VLTDVPVSVMLEFVGGFPAPPPLTRMFVFRIAEADSTVVELKYGMPPETPPVIVTG